MVTTHSSLFCRAAQSRSAPKVALTSPHKTAIECFMGRLGGSVGRGYTEARCVLVVICARTSQPKASGQQQHREVWSLCIPLPPLPAHAGGASLTVVNSGYCPRGDQHKSAEGKVVRQWPTRPEVPFSHGRWDTEMPVDKSLADAKQWHGNGTQDAVAQPYPLDLSIGPVLSSLRQHRIR